MTDVKESGDAMVKAMLPETSSSMTVLAVSHGVSVVQW